MKNIKIMTVVFTLLLMASFSTFAQEQQNTIKVKGVGEIAVNNNQGKINAEVAVKANLADAAIANNATLVQAVVTALSSVGISNDDIKTSSFRFNPTYRWEDQRKIFDGYSVTNSLSITVDDINTIGPVIDLMIESGVTRINSVSFAAVDIAELKQQALVKATEDARLKAEILANASNVTLGKAVQINLVSNIGTFVENGTAALSSPPPSVILPGSNNISVNVTIEYLIN